MADMQELRDAIFNKASEAGFTDYEIYISRGSNLEFTIYQLEVDTYNLTQDIGLSFRGIYKGKMGCSYTESISLDSVDALIDQAIQNAESIEIDDEIPIFEGSQKYEELDNYSEGFEKIEVEEKIKYALELEKSAKERDKRVKTVDDNIFLQGSSEKIIINNKGLNKHFKTNYGFSYLSVIVQDGDDIKTASKLKVSNDFSEYDPKKLAAEVVDEAVSMLGAKSVKSGNYKTIIRNTAAASLLSTFCGIFSAENVQKGLSLLKDKLGKEIGVSTLNIVDDPLMVDGASSSPFDDEGVATFRKNIIENGVLKTFLYNLKCAKKDGVKSTGNGQRGYKSPVGISPYNIYVQKGKTSYEGLINKMDNGLIITELQGLHSGANPISGDFSLSAKGYLVEDGNIKSSVEQITISGNFYDVLKNIEEIGDDLMFGFPGASYVGSPSILIKSMSIAGE